MHHPGQNSFAGIFSAGDRGSTGATGRPGLLPISPSQTRTHRANTVGPSSVRAFGADDGEPTRTPAAWMISLVPPSPKNHPFGVDDGPCISFLFPVPFSAWVTSPERYWVALAKRPRVRPWYS